MRGRHWRVSKCNNLHSSKEGMILFCTKELTSKISLHINFFYFPIRHSAVEHEEQDVTDAPRLTVHQNRFLLKRENNILKNYASVKCGAKLIASNDEASNPVAVLEESKDSYLLNPCSVNAWFVVQLCERIHVTIIHLANFEMFSSTPELFHVFGSRQFPTTKWKLIGSFQAKPEKKVQKFAIRERFYGDYVKVGAIYYLGIIPVVNTLAPVF